MRRPTVSQPASAASIRPGSSSTGRAVDEAQRRGLARRDADAVKRNLADARERAHAGIVAAAAGAADSDHRVRAVVVQRGFERQVAGDGAAAFAVDRAGDEGRGAAE